MQLIQGEEVLDDYERKRHLNVFFFPETWPQPRTMDEYQKIEKLRYDAMAIARDTMKEIGITHDMKIYSRLVIYFGTNINNKRYYQPPEDLRQSFNIAYEMIVSTIKVSIMGYTRKYPEVEIPKVTNMDIVEDVVKEAINVALHQVQMVGKTVIEKFTYNPIIQEASLCAYESKIVPFYYNGHYIIEGRHRYDVRFLHRSLKDVDRMYRFYDLPHEITAHIFSFLDYDSIQSVRMVSWSIEQIAKTQQKVCQIGRRVYAIYLSWFFRGQYRVKKHQQSCDCDDECVSVAWQHFFVISPSMPLVNRMTYKCYRVHITLDMSHVLSPRDGLSCFAHSQVECTLCRSGLYYTPGVDARDYIERTCCVMIQSEEVAVAICQYMQVNPFIMNIFQKSIIDFNDHVVCMFLMMEIMINRRDMVGSWIYRTFESYAYGCIYEYFVGVSLVGFYRSKRFPDYTRDLFYPYNESTYARRRGIDLAELYTDCKMSHSSSEGTLWYNVKKGLMIYEDGYDGTFYNDKISPLSLDLNSAGVNNFVARQYLINQDYAQRRERCEIIPEYEMCKQLLIYMFSRNRRLSDMS